MKIGRTLIKISGLVDLEEVYKKIHKIHVKNTSGLVMFLFTIPDAFDRPGLCKH